MRRSRSRGLKQSILEVVAVIEARNRDSWSLAPELAVRFVEPPNAPYWD